MRIASAIIIKTAVGVGIKGAVASLTDAIKLWTTNNGDWRRATVTEVLDKNTSDCRDICTGNAEASGSSAYLRDEIANFIRVKGHKFVYSRHAGISHIRGEAHLTIARAAQQYTEELIEVGEETTEMHQYGYSAPMWDLLLV